MYRNIEDGFQERPIKFLGYSNEIHSYPDSPHFRFIPSDVVISEHKVWFVQKTKNNHTRLIMKYIFISILIIPFVSVTILFSLSTPVFGKTSHFESVDECVMKTFREERDFTRLDGIKNLMEMMRNQNQTGNRMFDVVYSKCSKEVSNDRQVVNLPFTNTLPPKIWNIN